MSSPFSVPVTEPLEQALVAERRGPHVVAIGGGKGLAAALAAILRYAGRIDAIVTVADDGGSSGRLAPDLEIPPPGDIRKCLIALTPNDSVWRQLFEYRFDAADVSGHSLGNLIIASLADLEGDFGAALKAAEKLLGTVGSVIPVSRQRLHIEAVVDGNRVEGQVALALSRGNVEEMRLTPADALASSEALDAIAAADQIVIGPGSLYTSLLATLLVPEIVEAVNHSEARLVYVANASTQDGETLGMDCADHLEALIAMSGMRPPAAIVANETSVAFPPPLTALEVDEEVLATYGVDVVFGQLVDPTAAVPRHDPVRLGGALARLI
ncbi:MAG: uridine diphosphate-N-acetylglucosamine-binding protein YvcK [Actinomycetota bacterium]|nr:uridine diphosphate-N-acetylglucosamine-binding protein YvcK [Actinomycetota bacterium]